MMDQASYCGLASDEKNVYTLNRNIIRDWAWAGRFSQASSLPPVLRFPGMESKKHMERMVWFFNSSARMEGGSKVSTAAFSQTAARQVRRFHATISTYVPTPLVQLEGLAGFLGVKTIWIKDESPRFGLNAFKALGASYALVSAVAKRLDLPAGPLSLDTFRNPDIQRRLSGITCVTATDGNHGRAVAWLASEIGCRAVVYMPKGSSTARFKNIAELGAEVSIIDGNYDDAVRVAEKKAEEKGWLLIQDTAGTGYEETPRRVMQGYMTMIDEALEQIGEDTPTHVFAQCGVGAFSGACEGYLVQRFRARRPLFSVVEPVNAACCYESAVRQTGKPYAVKGELRTIMAGLACGEPNPIGWEILRDFADMFVACPDGVAMKGMRVLGNPMGMDQRVVSGESGAVTLGLLYHLLTDPEYTPLREELKLDGEASVLLFSTEGDTDPEMYRRIVWGS
jgi:diaminopropionate ammonia-lyase